MSDWIACADALPPDDRAVLVYGTNRLLPESRERFAVAMYLRGTYRLYGETRTYAHWEPCGVGGYEWEFDIVPTHWRALPEAPSC